MTDKEIIKALECCEIAYDQDCAECPLYPDDGEIVCREVLREEALDLITRQKAELENLKVENQSLRSAANSLKMHYEEAQVEIERLEERSVEVSKTIKSEAVKECIAKVKNYIKTHCNPYGKPDFDYDTSIKILNFIDKLVTEMVGENNG